MQIRLIPVYSIPSGRPEFNITTFKVVINGQLLGFWTCLDTHYNKQSLFTDLRKYQSTIYPILVFDPIRGETGSIDYEKRLAQIIRTTGKVKRNL